MSLIKNSMIECLQLNNKSILIYLNLNVNFDHHVQLLLNFLKTNLFEELALIN